MRAVGIDLGSHSFKIVVLDGTAKRPRVVGVAAEAFPRPGEGEDPAAARAAAVQNALRRLHAPRDPAVSVFPASECVFRSLTIPFKGEDQIRKVVKFESEGHLHQWSIEDVVVDYVPLGESKGQTTMLVAAVPKAAVRKHLQACEASGFDPQVVDLDATAVFHAAAATGAFAAEESLVLLHIGARSTHVLLVDEGKLKQIRAVRLGLEGVASGVERDLGVAADAASAKARDAFASAPEDLYVVQFEGSEAGETATAGVRGDLERPPESIERDLVGARVEEWFLRLGREVTRFIAASPMRRPPTRALVSGGGATTPGFPERIAPALGMPVEVLNPLERFEGSIPERDLAAAGPACAPALGAALRAIGDEGVGVDLRREELRFTRAFDRVKIPLFTALVLIVFGLALENVYLFRRRGTMERTYANYLDVAVRIARDEAGIRWSPPEGAAPRNRVLALRNDLGRRLDALREQMGHGEVGLPMSAFEGWRLLFDAIAEMKEEVGRFSIDRLHLDQRPKTGSTEEHLEVACDLTFFGDSVDASRRYEDLVNHLRGKGWVRDVTRAPTQKPADVGEATVYTGLKVKIVVPGTPEATS